MYTIYNASPEDITLIRSLAEQVWPQTYSAILTPDQITYMMELIYSESALHKQMEKGHRFLLLRDNDNPVGFASFNETEPSVFKLHQLYVLPSQQGRGSGKFIIDHIISEIKPRGATALRLNVNRYNKARSFYEKLGFVIIAKEDIDIGNGYFMNDYVMEKSLKTKSPKNENNRPYPS